MVARDCLLPAGTVADWLLESLETMDETQTKTLPAARIINKSDTPNWSLRIRVEAKLKGLQNALELFEAMQTSKAPPKGFSKRSVARWWKGGAIPNETAQERFCSFFKIKAFELFDDPEALKERKKILRQQLQATNETFDAKANSLGKKTKDILPQMAKAVKPNASEFKHTVSSLWKKPHLKPLLAFFVYWLEDQDAK